MPGNKNVHFQTFVEYACRSIRQCDIARCIIAHNIPYTWKTKRKYIWVLLCFEQYDELLQKKKLHYLLMQMLLKLYPSTKFDFVQLLYLWCNNINVTTHTHLTQKSKFTWTCIRLKRGKVYIITKMHFAENIWLFLYCCNV